MSAEWLGGNTPVGARNSRLTLRQNWLSALGGLAYQEENTF